MHKSQQSRDFQLYTQEASLFGCRFVFITLAYRCSRVACELIAPYSTSRFSARFRFAPMKPRGCGIVPWSAAFRIKVRGVSETTERHLHVKRADKEQGKYAVPSKHTTPKFVGKSQYLGSITSQSKLLENAEYAEFCLESVHQRQPVTWRTLRLRH